MNPRYAAAAAILLALTAGCVADGKDAAAPGGGPSTALASAESNTTVAAPSQTTAAAPVTTAAAPPATVAPTTTTAAPSQQPLHFEGTGPTVFALDGLISRAVFVKFTHTGSRNFIVSAFDAAGARDTGVANEIGQAEGTVLLDSFKMTGAPPASLEVQADGAWTIDIDHVGAAPQWDGVSPLVSAGKQVYFVPAKTKAQRVTLAHDGARNFIVHAHSTALGSSGGLVNHIGPYDGQKMMAKDVFLIAVQADGNWSIIPG